MRPRLACNLQAIGRRQFTSTLAHDPLRIAFFGTDRFTIHSLKALDRARASGAVPIERLDLITRPPKRAGRGRTLLKDALAAEYALANDIAILRAETKHEINLLANQGYNMAIAVSYGALIPELFISSLKYGGLNVHPSLLPTLAGAAPIHHALLQRLPTTGITVQTLHPKLLDRGRILSQTEEIPISPDDTVQTMVASLGKKGGECLVEVLTKGLFLDQALDLTDAKRHPPSPAPKITSKMKRISLRSHTASDILLLQKVTGSAHVFQTSRIYTRKNKKTTCLERTRRLILSKIEPAESMATFDRQFFSHLKLGQYDFLRDGKEEKMVLRVLDGFLAVATVLTEGYGAQPVYRFKLAKHKRGFLNNQLIVE